MRLKEFLKPTYGKAILALLMPLIWSGLSLAVVFIQNPGASVLLPQIPGGTAFSILFGILWGGLWSYPFACALYHLWPEYRKGKLASAVRRGEIIVSLLAFNPLSLALIGSFLLSSLMFFPLAQAPGIECGVELVAVFPDSPAERAGLHPGLVLIAVNGETIETVSELNDMLRNSKPGDRLIINSYLNGSSLRTFYDDSMAVTLAENPSEGAAYGYLGVNMTQRFTTTGYPCS